MICKNSALQDLKAGLHYPCQTGKAKIFVLLVFLPLILREGLQNAKTFCYLLRKKFEIIL